MTELEISQYIKENVTWSSSIKENPGGQHTNGPIRDVIGICEELSIKVCVGYYRSQIENKGLVITIIKEMIRQIFNNE